MARLVSDPFGAQAKLDEAVLSDLVATAVRMMDNVVDASRFPLEAQQREAEAKRRIGLGVTGLADALLMVGLRYGSVEAAAQTEAWMHQIARAAYLASVDLAKEKGAFPLFDAEGYLASGAMEQMDADVRDAIAKHGIRNALLTSIAPTGTISLYAGNVSSGIEPVFAYAYTRKVLQKDGTRTEEEVIDYAVQMWPTQSFPIILSMRKLWRLLSMSGCRLRRRNGSTARYRKRSTAPKISALRLSKTFIWPLGIKAAKAAPPIGPMRSQDLFYLCQRRAKKRPRPIQAPMWSISASL
jgi:hypothetical protein